MSDASSEDKERFQKFFETAKPSWQNDNYGIRGNNQQTNREQAPVAWPRATVTTQESLAAAASIEPPAPPNAQAEGGNTVFFSFLLEGSPDPDDSTNAKVLIHDGEVNGETPPGMGSDDYTLDVNFDGAFINLLVTYNTVTLETTSLTFAVESDVADPTLGEFRVEIGRVYLDFDGDGNVSNVFVLNTQCGDINFALIYGAFNGSPALIPLNTYSQWVPLS